jgi:hypothetical protein
LNAGDLYDKKMIERFSHEIKSDQIICCNTQLVDLKVRFIGILKVDPEKL